MSLELILTGSFGVGKSTIFNRFIHQEFNDKYYGTIGIRVNKRTVTVDNQEVTLKLWDTAGELRQDKVPTAYFKGKDVILYIVDLSRSFSFKNIPEDLAFHKKNSPDSKLMVVGNKIDLLQNGRLEKYQSAAYSIKFDWFISAKTGEKVEELFQSIAASYNYTK